MKLRVLPSIVLPSIPSPISRQCHLTPASLTCRQTKWFHNQYERRCNPACFRTLMQTGNNWIRPANQIRNNQCNKNESVISEGRPDWVYQSTIMIHFKPRSKRVFMLGTVKPAHLINYIISAMASTRSKPLFNYFRAHVHASMRCLLSKEAPFQQPLRNGRPLATASR
jgi:hypothetical protein